MISTSFRRDSSLLVFVYITYRIFFITVVSVIKNSIFRGWPCATDSFRLCHVAAPLIIIVRDIYWLSVEESVALTFSNKVLP